MNSNAFSNHFEEDIESLNFAHQLGILYLHTLTAFVSEILLVCTISASSTYS